MHKARYKLEEGYDDLISKSFLKVDRALPNVFVPEWRSYNFWSNLSSLPGAHVLVRALVIL